MGFVLQAVTNGWVPKKNVSFVENILHISNTITIVLNILHAMQRPTSQIYITIIKKLYRLFLNMMVNIIDMRKNTYCGSIQ